VSIGQAVSGSGGFNSGTEVLTIADLHNLIINAHINQADISRLHQDQQVEVAVEAVPGLVVMGRIERIAPQATIRNNIKGFAVRIFLKDADKLREALEGSGVHWVQLHGYQTPGVVRAVKEISPDIRVLKVLHVRGDDCVEAPLIGSYEKAGVDVFLFDAVAKDGRVGSTGETLDPAVVASLAEQISRPFLLAGGLSDDNRDESAQDSPNLDLGDPFADPF